MYIQNALKNITVKNLINFQLFNWKCRIFNRKWVSQTTWTTFLWSTPYIDHFSKTTPLYLQDSKIIKSAERLRNVMKLPESKWSAARYVFIFIYGYYLYKCGAPSGLRECVNGLFWLRGCVKMEKKLRECVNWKNLHERENPLLDCENAWICPIFA